MKLKEKIKRNPLKTLWIIWLALALGTTATLTFMDVANHAPELPVKLQAGKELTWRVWRPFATLDTQFEMSYQRGANGDLRMQVLGDREQQIKGEPVVMALSVNGRECLYQQIDVNGWNSRVFRALEPVDSQCRLPEKSGLNEWRAKIVDVSPALMGEKTRLGMISPSGSLKQRAKNVYGKMAEWLFWGELVWLPFFLLMSLPLWLDGINRLAQQYRWQYKISQFWRKIMWNLRHKW